MSILRTTDINDIEDYFGLIENIYGKSESVIKFSNESRKGLEKISSSEQNKPVFFQIRSSAQLCGQIALIPYGNDEAFFGFFECAELSLINDLWKELLNEATNKKIKKLFGPVNGTIWHPYRFVSKTTDEPFFPTEPISRIEYNTVFKSFNPAYIVEYHSAFRTDYSGIIKATQKSFSEGNEKGIEISIQRPDYELMKVIYKMAVQVFSANPGYTHISFEEFVSIYKENSSDKGKSLIYLAKKEGQLLGFCLTLKFNNTLFMKTIAVLPEWQQKGIANALVYKIHSDASAEKADKVIYALVRKDNNVRYFPIDNVTIFREYNAYLFML